MQKTLNANMHLSTFSLIDSKSLRGSIMSNAQRIKELKAEVKILRLQHKAVTEKLTAIMAEIDMLQDETDNARIAKGKTDIKWLLSEDGRGSTAKYKASSEFLQNLGFSSSGYSPSIKQRVVTCIVQPADDLDKIAANMEMLLPFILPRDGIKIFDLLEHTCAQYGSYSLYIDEDKKVYELSKISYGHRQTEFGCDSLKSLLAYVQKHHPYH